MLTVKVDVSALQECAKIILIEVPLASRVKQLADVVNDLQNGENVEASSLHFWTRTGKRLQNKLQLRHTRLTDQPFLVAEVCSRPQSKSSESLKVNSARRLTNDVEDENCSLKNDEKVENVKSSGISDSRSFKDFRNESTNRFEKSRKGKRSCKEYVLSKAATNCLVKRDESTGQNVRDESTGQNVTSDNKINFESKCQSSCVHPPVNRDVAENVCHLDSLSSRAKDAIPGVCCVPTDPNGQNEPPTILTKKSDSSIDKVQGETLESRKQALHQKMSQLEVSCGNDESDDDIQIIHVSGEETVTNQQIESFMTAIFQRHNERKIPRSPDIELVMKRLEEAYPKHITGREEMVKTIYSELLRSCPKRNDGLKVESVVGSYQLTNEDFATLQDGCWLNDNIINAYFYLLAVADPTVYPFSTFFYPTLKKGYKSVQKWTKKKNLFKYRLLVVPVHLDNHWTVATINVKCQMIEYYDSIGSENAACLRNLKKFMLLEASHHPNPKWMQKTWKISTVEGTVPRQTVGGDCGVFACQFAKCMIAREPADFHQNQMPQIRRQMSKDIHRGQVNV